METKKYFTSEPKEVKRSEIHPAAYNPRKIDEQGRKALRRSIKKFGVVGGIVVNSRTGNTIVGGHQKVLILDEMNGFPKNDYTLRVEMVDVDEATEKTLNVTLNNPNVGGMWDYDALRKMIPDIDYKAAGLTDSDLNLIGVDFMLQTDGERDLAKEILGMKPEAQPQKKEEPPQTEDDADTEERLPESEEEEDEDGEPEEKGYEERKAHMMEVKTTEKAKADARARAMEAYVVLSFSDYDSKAAFCERFGIDPTQRYVKGEEFDAICERVYEE